MEPSKSKNNLVIKSNALIEARYRLSLQEQHIILWLLTQIKPEDEELKIHSMQIKDFAKMLDIDLGNQYKELRKVTMRLIQRGLSIYEPNLEEWLQVTWLNSVRYVKKLGVIELGFSDKLKPYLLQLKRCFTKINISSSLKFKSIYAVRLFELLVQYDSIGKRKTTIEDLRLWCGIEENEYIDYFDLKRKVINRAKSEINAKTDYEIDYKEIKQSRKVVEIEWTIKNKTEQEEKADMSTRGLKSDINFIPIDYTVCSSPEILEFCKIHESKIGRPFIDYLLQVTAFDKNSTTLKLTFSGGFFRDRSENSEVVKALTEYFKVKNVEFL